MFYYTYFSQKNNIFNRIQHYLLIGFIILLSACNEAVLYKNVEENEVNLMASILLREGIDASRIANKDGTYNLIISDARYFPEAIDALSVRGFPKTKFESLCTIFKGEGMVSTPIEQKARYTCAKAQELSGSLTELDGVSKARVHLVLSETDPISRKVKPASASVMIKYKTGMDIDVLTPKVKQLISYAVEDLPYQNVSVMLSEELGRKDMIVSQALNNPNNHNNANTKQKEVPDLFPAEDNTNNSNTIILYVALFILMLGMIIIAFFMFRIKSQQSENDNLPVEF